MRILALFTLLASVACVTAYQPSGFMGGFTESRLGPDLFTVRFNANAFTGAARVHDFTMLRAAELTLKSGYRYFVILAEKDTTSRQQSTHTSYNSFWGGWNTNQSSTIKPGQEIRVRCFRDKPRGNTYVYDARFIETEMRQKYSLAEDLE